MAPPKFVKSLIRHNTVPPSSLAFLLACVIYALSSRPTPESLGESEFAIMLALATTLCLSGGYHALNPLHLQRPHAPWFHVGVGFILFSLSLPLWIGLTSGAGGGISITAILRDMIGLVFWILPLLLLFSAKENNHKIFQNTLIAALLLIGICFASRFLWSLYQVTGGIFIAPAHPDILLELVNVPTVLFSALYLMGMGLRNLSTHHWRSVAIGIGMISLATIPVAAGICALQRANIGALAILTVGLFAMQFIIAPRRILFSSLICILALVILWPYVTETLTLMLEKTRLVGFNQRFEEAEAIFAHMDRLSPTMMFEPYLFGLGWGAGFTSPASGFIEITFTHNFFMTLWLKTGVLGMFLAGLYVWLILKSLAGSITGAIIKNKDISLFVLGLAVFLPILVNLFLYANHKSFDFGLLLTLAALVGHSQNKNSHKENHQGEP